FVLNNSAKIAKKRTLAALAIAALAPVCPACSGAPRSRLEKHSDMGNRRVVSAHAFRRFRFNANLVRLDPQQLSHTGLAGPGMRAYPGFGKNQRGVHVYDRIAGFSYLLDGLGKKNYRVGALPPGIGRGKVRSDVPGRHGAQERVSQCVQQDVAVRVASEALVMGKLHAADLEWNPRTKFVQVPSVANSHELPTADTRG